MWQIRKQKNGKYKIYSTIVNADIWVECEKRDIYVIFAQRATKESNDHVDRMFRQIEKEESK